VASEPPSRDERAHLRSGGLGGVAARYREHAPKTIVDKQRAGNSDKERRASRILAAICAASPPALSRNARIVPEKMCPQHNETLRRLRGRVTSLANRAARRPPDIQSRLGTRGDCMGRSAAPLHRSTVTEADICANRDRRNRSLSRWDLRGTRAAPS